MHLGLPRGLSIRDRKRYMALWREMNRERLRKYNRKYQRIRRSEQKNGEKTV
jgi:hypothetical protein